MQITNEAADIINEYILFYEYGETISSIEDAVQLNKEFNNQFDINAYYYPYRKYNNELNNGDIYCLGENLYESIYLYGMNHFLKLLNINNESFILKKFQELKSFKQLLIYNDPIGKYFIHKFNLDLKI